MNRPMKIALTGASGFIGTSIQHSLLMKGSEFFVLKRDDSDEEWCSILEQVDVVVNLAGAPVIQRWTLRNKTIIRSSRILTTQRLVALLNDLNPEKCPRTLISASAIGIYPDDGVGINDESSDQLGQGFLSEVVKDWEQEALRLENGTTRLAIVRIGVVLGRDGGLLKKTLPLFRLGLGGVIASGNQKMSFIHIDDLIKAIFFVIKHNSLKGIFNLVAPRTISNRGFTRTMGQILHRPTWIPVPSFVLYLLYGKAADIMVNGENVYPANLLKNDFEFDYPTIERALVNLLK